MLELFQLLLINIVVDFLSFAVEDWFSTAVLPVCKKEILSKL